MTGFCDIVVDGCPRPDLARTLEFARLMGSAFKARLTIASYAWPRTSPKDVLLANALTAQRQTRLMEEALAASRNVFDKVFAGERGQTEWSAAISEPGARMREHLLTADLLITGSSVDDACVVPDPASLALESGVPVLRLGQHSSVSPFSRVLVAWKDSSQARRALHESLPILQSAESVAVVGVGDEVSEDRLAAVVEHLGRHGVRAHHQHIPETDQDVAWALLGQAQREDASLVVTGLFSRGSLTERIFGGVSADMLKNAETSWFMAH